MVYLFIESKRGGKRVLFIFFFFFETIKAKVFAICD